MLQVGMHPAGTGPRVLTGNKLILALRILGVKAGALLAQAGGHLDNSLLLHN